jgi:hypothetical protein
VQGEREPLGVEEMGRPKKGVGRVEKPGDDRVAIIHLKGSQAYSQWLEEIHKKTHLPKATIFRLAVETWAEKNGHGKPPEF